MNFNLYIDKETGDRLARLAKTKRTTRNALIREAVARMLGREGNGGWPPDVRDFAGLPEAHPFEEARRALRNPGKDPFA